MAETRVVPVVPPRRRCRFFHSATGCALGSICPDLHTCSGPNASPATPSGPTPRGEDETIVWVYRENRHGACAPAWRRFNDHWSRMLEDTFQRHQDRSRNGAEDREEVAVPGRSLDVDVVDGAGVEPLGGGSLGVCFRRMLLCDRFTLGARRPVQRLFVSTRHPQWFAVPSHAAASGLTVLHLSPTSAGEVLEYDYLTGRRSCYGLEACDEPSWINLHTMRMTVLRDGAVFELYRQPGQVRPGCPASNLHAHPLLLSRSFLLDAASARPLFECGAAQRVVLEHNVDAEVGRPLPLDLSAVRPPTAPAAHVVSPAVCSSGTACVVGGTGRAAAGSSSAHLREALHPCPNGRRAECFLCHAATLELDASPELSDRSANHRRFFTTSESSTPSLHQQQPHGTAPVVFVDEGIVESWMRAQRTDAHPLRRAWRANLANASARVSPGLGAAARRGSTFTTSTPAATAAMTTLGIRDDEDTLLGLERSLSASRTCAAAKLTPIRGSALESIRPLLVPPESPPEQPQCPAFAYNKEEVFVERVDDEFRFRSFLRWRNEAFRAWLLHAARRDAAAASTTVHGGRLPRSGGGGRSEHHQRVVLASTEEVLFGVFLSVDAAVDSIGVSPATAFYSSPIAALNAFASGTHAEEEEEKEPTQVQGEATREGGPKAGADRRPIFLAAVAAYRGVCTVNEATSVRDARFAHCGDDSSGDSRRFLCSTVATLPDGGVVLLDGSQWSPLYVATFTG